MTESERILARLPKVIARGDIEKVLRAVISESDPWEWFSSARIPFPFAVEILRVLGDADCLVFNPTRLTLRGTELATELGIRPAPNMVCATCEGSGMDWDSINQVYSEYISIFEGRPRGENPNLDQGAMTPQSLFRRIALMMNSGDVAGKDIAALGDDDLASVALALSHQAAQVTVFELDPRICEYIDHVAKGRTLNIRVIEQDLAARLPPELLGSFDTFVCDPPETEAGLLLFVEKGLSLLKKGDGHAGYFGATVMEASLTKWKRWQTRILNDHEIAFTHILPPFTSYESWPDEKPVADLEPLAKLSNHPWYRFAFYRLETLPTFQPVPDFILENTQVFYFDEESYYEAFLK